jgi:hypothetical protein
MPPNSFIVKCIATVDEGRGLRKALLVPDAAAEVNGEHIFSSLRPSIVEFEGDKFYRITVQEVDELDLEDLLRR